MDVCHENLARLDAEPLLLRHVISSDESWCYSYDPVRKHQSDSWLLPGDPRPLKALRSHSQKRIMLVVFFDDAGVVHHEFTQKMVNWYHYTNILACLRESIRKKRAGLWSPGFGHLHRALLHHDNAPAHTAIHT